MFSNLFFLFQTPPTDTTGLEPTVTSFSLIGVVAQGGAIGITIAIILLMLSAMAIYILIERYLTIKRAGEVDDNFMKEIGNFVQNGDIQSAINKCNVTDTPVARLVSKGLQRIGKPLEDINTAVQNVGNLEIYKLEKRLSLLATISGAAPMIGFLGTVTGMILSFMNMADGDVSPSSLAGGIYQALITTAFGLVVGIIAFIGYNTLIAQMDRVVFKMEAATVEFLDLLQEPAKH